MTAPAHRRTLREKIGMVVRRVRAQDAEGRVATPMLAVDLFAADEILQLVDQCAKSADAPKAPDASPGAYDIDPDALAMAQAVSAWRQRTGRSFPTFTELVWMMRRDGWVRSSGGQVTHG